MRSGRNPGPRAARGSMLLMMSFGYLALLAGMALAVELGIAIHLGAGVSTAARLGASAARDHADVAAVVTPRLDRLSTALDAPPSWSVGDGAIEVRASSPTSVGRIFGVEDFAVSSTAPLR